jgi:hypothetical protein
MRKHKLTVIISLTLYSECDNIPLVELAVNNFICGKQKAAFIAIVLKSCIILIQSNHKSSYSSVHYFDDQKCIWYYSE